MRFFQLGVAALFVGWTWLPGVSAASQHRKSIANMTCSFVTQPLNHFSLPRDRIGTFQQRYCVDNSYVLDVSNATVFLYTGNESPLEMYINHTGLLWELAATFHAQVVFIEHRYEGQSLPSPDIPNCLAYSSSIQALADYAWFIEKHLFATAAGDSSTVSSSTTRPVIGFGGSYGGMLTAWMRMTYPHLVAGGIAASAPIWGFPTNFPDHIDTAWQVVQHGLEQPYPPTAAAAAAAVHDENDPAHEKSKAAPNETEENHCARNLLAAWPLITYLGQDEDGRKLLTDSFRLCSPLGPDDDVDKLLRWGQTPWFDLAEGSFPYPSSYIPFALTHNDRATLPAWPLQAACWRHSELHKDLGVRFQGNVSDVRYDLLFLPSNLVLSVDWDNVTRKEETATLANVDALARLLISVRDAVAIWYNITGDVSCYELSPAPNTRTGTDIGVVWKGATPGGVPKESVARSLVVSNAEPEFDQNNNQNATEDCRAKMKQSGSWNALCCNEEMNLIITEAQGLGNDFLWPPSHPRGTRTHADVIAADAGLWNQTLGFCHDPQGHYGFPSNPPDPWSRWYDTVYGGVRIQSHSNIIFSNGLLDPWSAAGVYATTTRNDGRSTRNVDEVVMPGLYLQHVNDRDLIALVMEYGGHHTDLMYSSSKDPPSIQKARQIEKEYIAKWIDQWWQDYH